jgi:hypothetical protein
MILNVCTPAKPWGVMEIFSGIGWATTESPLGSAAEEVSESCANALPQMKMAHARSWKNKDGFNATSSMQKVKNDYVFIYGRRWFTDWNC